MEYLSCFENSLYRFLKENGLRFKKLSKRTVIMFQF